MEHFNKLSPEVQELIVILGEECDEVAQACAKILRHGIRVNPYDGKLNRINLEEELCDVLVIMDLLDRLGVISLERVESRRPAKLQRLSRPEILHHSTLLTVAACSICGSTEGAQVDDSKGTSMCKNAGACSDRHFRKR